MSDFSYNISAFNYEIASLRYVSIVYETIEKYNVAIIRWLAVQLNVTFCILGSSQVRKQVLGFRKQFSIADLFDIDNGNW